MCNAMVARPPGPTSSRFADTSLCSFAGDASGGGPVDSSPSSIRQSRILAGPATSRTYRTRSVAATRALPSGCPRSCWLHYAVDGRRSPSGRPSRPRQPICAIAPSSAGSSERTIRGRPLRRRSLWWPRCSKSMAILRSRRVVRPPGQVKIASFVMRARPSPSTPASRWWGWRTWWGRHRTISAGFSDAGRVRPSLATATASASEGHWSGWRQAKGISRGSPPTSGSRTTRTWCELSAQRSTRRRHGCDPSCAMTSTL